jgi:predicted DNA repair protein MutK
MASGFFAILDDIAALMDDVAAMSKVATKKTAGILGDDLAVNAEKSTGFVSSRELPVLWKITKGSFINKVIIVPLVLTLNYFLPQAVIYILILGGVYLAYEGVEKIVEFLFHKKNEKKILKEAKNEEITDDEKEKVKSAITTDFILSLEIVIIALSAALEKSFQIQVLTVIVVSIIATIGVYGIVALIVRMDDLGFLLIRKSNNKGFVAAIGNFLINLLPWIIKILSVVGTLALLLVSGGIFDHNIEFFHHLFPGLNETLKHFILGLIVGGIAVAIMLLGQKINKLFK